jgi:Tfp pilus assembly protein PilV
MVSKKISGLTLLEVLLSLALLSFALLGMDAMEVQAFTKASEIYYFSVAANQMQIISDRLRVLGSSAGRHSLVASWQAQNLEVLPQGRGVITGSYPVYAINIYWGINYDPCLQTQLGLSGCLKETINVAV